MERRAALRRPWGLVARPAHLPSPVGELRVFDPRRSPIGVIWPVKGVQVAWVRNGAAGAQFTVPQAGLRWSTTFLRELNKVEYHHPNLPYVWIGEIIDLDPKGNEVTISCLSAENVYTLEFTEDWVQVVGTGGAIAQVVHEQAVRRGPTGITLGNIDNSGVEYYVLFQQKDCFTALDDLVKQTGADWWVQKTGHEHGDPWQFCYDRSRGLDLTASNIIGAEVVDVPAFKRSAGGLITTAYVLGGGTGSELWQRIHYELPDRAAERVYNRRAGQLEFKDVIDLSLLQESAMRALELRARPALTLGLNIDDRRSAWGSFWLADDIRLILSGVDWVGLDSTVTVWGIQVDVDAGKMGLVVTVDI